MSKIGTHVGIHSGVGWVPHPYHSLFRRSARPSDPAGRGNGPQISLPTRELEVASACDLRFGMGPSSTRIGEPTRRDRLGLVSAFATALLTLLGAVGESPGMDRLLKSNATNTRTHSLFRQGCTLYELIPTMPEQRLAPSTERVAEAVSSTGLFQAAIAVSKCGGG